MNDEYGTRMQERDEDLAASYDTIGSLTLDKADLQKQLKTTNRSNTRLVWELRLAVALAVLYALARLVKWLFNPQWLKWIK